jgi:hypothetical protein
MFRTRRKSIVDFGLWSTANVIASSTTAKVTGTRCGIPATSTVAIRATRAAANRLRASSRPSFMG